MLIVTTKCFFFFAWVSLTAFRRPECFSSEKQANTFLSDAGFQAQRTHS